MKNLFVLFVCSVLLVGCSGEAGADKEEKSATDKKSNKEVQSKETLEYKRLPVDVDQFRRNYEAVAMISEGDPLPLPEKLTIKEDDKANFIELYSNLDSDPEDYPPTVYNLVLNKKDNTLRGVSYVGSG